MNKSKLKIAYFLDNFFPQINGVVTSSINTAKEMSHLGHKIFGIVPSIKKSLDYEEDYFPFPTYIQNGFEASFYPDFIFTFPFSNSLFKAVKSFLPDIIHFHAPFTIGYQAIRIARKLKIPVVGTFHTFFAEPEYLDVIKLGKLKLFQFIGWWYSNQFFDRCDAVVSPSNATASILKNNNLKKHIPLHIISNGIEYSKYSNFNFVNKFPIEIDEKDRYAIYVGRVSNEKCLNVLFNAVSLIKDSHNLKLIIVGGGPDLEKHKNEIKLKNLDKNIFFTGMIPNKELLESGIFHKVKFFVTASTSENQPMTILESMMFGLPIIGPDAKGIPEMIEHGNGLIFKSNDVEDLANKMKIFLDDEDLRIKCSKRSIELIPNHDIKNTTQIMEKLYYDTIENYNKN